MLQNNCWNSILIWKYHKDTEIPILYNAMLGNFKDQINYDACFFSSFDLDVYINMSLKNNQHKNQII